MCRNTVKQTAVSTVKLNRLLQTEEPVWNYETQKGTVLYLALEDSFARLQGRLLDITDDAPSNLKLAVKSGTLKDGLKEQIENFCESCDDLRLIVIDTLQKVRSGGDSSAQYAQDYNDMDVLKELAFEHKTSILLIHHLRKMDASDPLNKLSGSTGLTGEVDSVFVLEKSRRNENGATLFCTGRDITQKEIPLAFNHDTHVWELTSEQEHVPLIDPTIKFVSEFLDGLPTKSFSGTATELSDKIFELTGNRISNSILSKQLQRHPTQLENLGYKCHVSRTKNTRNISILPLE